MNDNATKPLNALNISSEQYKQDQKFNFNPFNRASAQQNQINCQFPSINNNNRCNNPFENPFNTGLSNQVINKCINNEPTKPKCNNPFKGTGMEWDEKVFTE